MTCSDASDFSTNKKTMGLTYNCYFFCATLFFADKQTLIYTSTTIVIICFYLTNTSIVTTSIIDDVVLITILD